MANPALNIALNRVEALPSVVLRYKSVVSAAIRESLADDTLPVYEMLRYSIGWADLNGVRVEAAEGKALRPTLCLFACEATGGSVSKALPAAVALELIHNFSLIHDDIQDRDETRHHRPTLWAVWGEPKALVAGNILRVIADMSLWRLVESGLSHQESLNATGLLTDAYLEMIEGQYLDLSYESRPDIGMRDYLEMIAKKTGALIRCALNLGAMIGTRDTRTVQAFRDCGRSLGLVFQVRDDVLGIWGQEQATGKPVGADIRRKKNSLPVVYAMSRAKGKDKDTLQDIYRRPTVGDDDVTTALNIMDKVKTREFAHSLAQEHRDRAIESVAGIELAPGAVEDLKELAEFLLAREH